MTDQNWSVSSQNAAQPVTLSDQIVLKSTEATSIHQHTDSAAIKKLREIWATVTDRIWAVTDCVSDHFDTQLLHPGRGREPI